MFRFFSSPPLGVEISSRAVKLGVLPPKGSPSQKPRAKAIPLPPGMVGDAFASPNIKDLEAFTTLVRGELREFLPLKTRRIGLSLPDTVFRVVSLEFDELPARVPDRDRLVRWRVEKSAAFDVSNAVLRYQVSPREGRGYSVLASMAKRDVLDQYEDLLSGLGYDTWLVSPASFHALNFYFPSLQARGVQGLSFAWITEGSYAVLVAEQGIPRFYRCKEIRQGAADAKDRVLRELEDSLHFYTHMDRQQLSQIGHLFLGGDSSMLSALAGDLKSALALEVEVLDLRTALPASEGTPDAFSSVFGAGGRQ